MKLLPLVITTLAVCSIQFTDAKRRGRKKSKLQQTFNKKLPSTAWIKEHSPCLERTEQQDPKGAKLKEINWKCFSKNGQCHVRNFKTKIWKMNEDVDHHVNRAKAKECLIVTRKCCMRACVANSKIADWGNQAYCNVEDVFDLDMVSNFCQDELVEKCHDNIIKPWEFIPGLAKKPVKVKKVVEANQGSPVSPSLSKSPSNSPAVSASASKAETAEEPAKEPAKEPEPKPAPAAPIAGAAKKWKPFLHHVKNPRTRLMSMMRQPLEVTAVHNSGTASKSGAKIPIMVKIPVKEPRTKEQIMAALAKVSGSNSRVSAVKRPRIGFSGSHYQVGRMGRPGIGSNKGHIYGRK